MKLSIATNFDDALIEAVRGLSVRELYGKAGSDPVGGGRSSYMIGRLGRRRIREHIALTRKRGMGFNYLLNASCMDNREVTRRGQKEIRGLLDRVVSWGASAVTVSNPFLLNLIKKNYPELKVRVSVFACVDHLRKARFWEDHGADVICLDSHTVNRDFNTLRMMRQNLKCGLELLANNQCLQSCYMAQTHPQVMAHSSQTGHASGGFVIDHCMLFCLKMKIKDPVNLIRADWIRPEDTVHYENIGIGDFKLSERSIPTSEMVRRVRAYHERRYDGNLLDLIQGFGFREAAPSGGGFFRKTGLFFRPDKVNVFKLSPIRKLCRIRGMLSPLKNGNPVMIDNQKLDGFIDRFLKTGCRNVCCEDCRYCHRFAEKAVTVDPDFRKECLSLHEKIDEQILDGSMF